MVLIIKPCQKPKIKTKKAEDSNHTEKVSQTKDTEDLFVELEKGECELVVVTGVKGETNILRRVNVMELMVFKKEKGVIYGAYELYRKGGDGRVDKDGNSYDYFLEKMEPGEADLDGAMRTVQEEMTVSDVEMEGIESTLKDAFTIQPTDTKNSRTDRSVKSSYPGLDSEYKTRHYSLIVDSESELQHLTKKPYIVEYFEDTSEEEKKKLESWLSSVDASDQSAETQNKLKYSFKSVFAWKEVDSRKAD